MSTSELINKLKQAASSDEVARAVFTLWGTRDRARSIVTVSTLKLSMTNAGFHYSHQKYEDFLKMLAAIGIGKIHWSSRGKVYALTDIRLTLQSIAQAAMGGETGLKSLKTKHKFEKLAEVQEEKKAEIEKAKKSALWLTVMVGKKPVNVSVPSDLSPEELQALFRGLENMRSV